MLERQCKMDMSNGFSNVNVNKMIESSRNWNLANDVELLKCLEKFSENIVNNATLTLSSMDNLEDSLNETFLKVRTVANKFQAIADNQFIENRVQDEEDFVLANDEKDILENQKSTENSKAQILDCIKDCQNVLRNKFETVQLSGIDSEDEMANSSPVVLVPKNAYKERPLPHLIGGEKFKTDETLGLGPAGDSIDDSIESDDDADKTDGSSYYSSNAIKETINQVQSSKLSAEPVADYTQRDSPKKDHIPEPPPFMHSHFSFDPPRIVDDPLPSDLLTNTLLPEAPILYEPSDELFSDVVMPIDKDPSAANGVEDEGDLLSTNKTDIEEARHVPVKTSVSREQLLAGRNFASFKEDLARVLSGGAKPIRKQSSSDSDESRSYVSSPAQGDDGEKKGAFEDLSPQPRTSSFPANRSAALSGSDHSIRSSTPLSSPSHSGGVTLPSVSTNVLENLAKGRAKVKGKRRPPSRKHRQANVNEESYSADQNTNPSNSTHSEDTSVHESSSTQPGSNILSPATDEEDLFVLPAFDLPSDPPNRGLFFGNSLLSPGTTIDDGGVSNSPLFPTETHADILPSIPPNITANASNYSHSVSSKKSTPVKIEKPNLKSNVNETPPADLFSSSKGESNDNNKQLNVTKISDHVVTDTDLFSNTSSMNDGLNEKVDIFSSTSNENEFSSSPPLFSDWAQSPDSSKINNKSTSKSSKQLGLNWGFLGSDDISEDLFRSQKKESPAVPSMDEPNASKFVVGKRDEINIFSPSPSLGFEGRGGGTLFEDENSHSAPDIFAGSSSFMGLSLPKNSEDSLFASDDDEDDDSLFKSTKSSSILKSSEKPAKPQGTYQGKIHSLQKNSTTRELVDDPLSSMDLLE
uniref:WASH complex subunit FAM21 n=1 Tax=Lygus hesperus TaxID=30085 RepID=A0A0A9XWT2_LYGHE